MVREANGAAEPGGPSTSRALCRSAHSRSADQRSVLVAERRSPCALPDGPPAYISNAAGPAGPRAARMFITRRSSPEACFAIVRGPAFFRVGAIGIDRPVGEHQLPAFTGPELGLNGVEQDVRRLVRRAELSALLQEAPGDEECVLDGAANGHGCQRGAAVAVPRDRRMPCINERARATSASC